MKNYVRAKGLNVCGAPVFLHWSALVVMGGCLAMAVSDPLVAIVAAISYFSVILIHESGHAFVASRLGYEVFSIRLSVIHGECIYDASYETSREAALIAWGGPLAQFAAAALFGCFGQPGPRLGDGRSASMAPHSHAVARSSGAEEAARQSREIQGSQMSRVFTWKTLSVAVGLVLAAGVICLSAGHTDMASALFVVAVLEGVVGAGVVAVISSRQKEKHLTTP